MNKNLPDNSINSLTYAWSNYLIWAGTSRKLKASLNGWRLVVLCLSCLGALFSVLCQYSDNWGSVVSLPWFKIFGYSATVSLGCAAYFSKEILSPGREKNWIRARSLAEAFKSEVYLYATQSPPYHQENALQQLFQQSHELISQVNDMTPESLDKDALQKRPCPSNMSIDDYINDRLSDQINFYQNAYQKNNRNIKKGQTTVWVMGSFSIILGGAGTLFDQAAIISWVAVLTTMTTAFTAYLFACRFQYLATSYWATGEKLKGLLSQRNDSLKSNSNERNRFIQNCEQVISVENASWLSKWVSEERNENEPKT